jgi:hypothetical protein
MAQQQGVLQLTGGMGNLSFYRTKDGYAARVKGGVSADRIANDPKFVRTRENGREFGRAGQCGKLFRTAFAGLIPKADHRLTGRLVKTLMQCIKADTASARGERIITPASLQAVAGFDFNRNSNLGVTLKAPYTTGINRATGVLDVSIPAFLPEKLIAAPAGATHFKLVTGGAAVDFAGSVYDSGTDASGYLDIAIQTAAVAMSVSLTAAATAPLFLALGVQFYQQVNGAYYPLSNGSFDALGIVKVDA